VTAIVVHKSGDMQSGPGFFELAKSLGKNTKDALACWVSEFNKVMTIGPTSVERDEMHAGHRQVIAEKVASTVRALELL